jgi:biopolymer transport protein ExbB
MPTTLGTLEPLTFKASTLAHPLGETMNVRKLFFAPLAALLIAVAGASSTTVLAQSAPAAPAAAPVAVAPATPAAAAPTAKQSIENPYGLEAMWRDGDWVTKGTFAIMVIMSMASWYVMFTKYFEQSKIIRAGDAASKNFWTSGSIKGGVDKLDQGSAFRYIAEQGLKASDHHEGGMQASIDRHTWVGMGIQRAVESVQNRLQDGLAVLATVGSTAPFVGLFGTVWGIYHALTAIGISGQASIDKVAGPVGEALIMTAIGLAVAVPAVMGYNWLIRRNKSAMERVRSFSGDLHSVLLAGKR